ncbi:hypothetical protein ACOMHN_054290 [Nucella lapillus]
MAVHLFVLSLCLLLRARVSSGQSCTTSSKCVVGQCCRNVQTNAPIVYDPSAFRYVLQNNNNQNGQCTNGGAQPGEQCDSYCKCGPGYSCYRAPTGVCCGNPGTCIAECEARKRRIFDRCYPPPMAPGGGGPSSGGLARRRRRRVPLLSESVSVCQLLMKNPSALNNMCGSG